MSGAARGTEGAVDERGNPFWTYDSPTGPLEITINLAKPENCLLYTSDAADD